MAAGFRDDASDERVVRAHLQSWADELVDLTRRNRLLYFSHTRASSLEFSQDAAQVDARLENSKGWGFFLPPVPPEDSESPFYPPSPTHDELVVSFKDRYGPQIERSLKTLTKKAEAEFLDTGIWVLYLGLGCLDWIDVDGKPAQSPLLLVPVALHQEGADKRWRLTRSDDAESALNPALAVKLERDFGIVLPTLDDLPDASVDTILETIEQLISHPRWTVRRTAVMRTFTFHKAVIYRDLRQNLDQIAQHPIVKLLAEGPSSAVAAVLDFAPVREDRLDELHPPEDLACVLDADATQRQCLIAARAGRSFVMDGPPGTGKSQTITNVIAQLLADGKTVLFVSEKAAALEVVHNRLKALRLDPFVLELHSHNATRKAVAATLGRELEQRPEARSRVDETKRTRLRQERKQLTDYAIAVNELRQPLQRSLHDVIGRLAELGALPALPVALIPITQLDPLTFVQLREAADRLGRAWGPVSRQNEFIWRDLINDHAGAAREADLRGRVTACQTALIALLSAATTVTDELMLAPNERVDQITDLIDLLALIERRTLVGELWLTLPAPDVAARAVRELASDLRSRAVAKDFLDTSAAGWASLDPSLADDLAAAETTLLRSNPPFSPLDQLKAPALQEMAGVLDEAGLAIEHFNPAATRLAAAFGIHHEPSVGLTERLIELAKLAASPNLPEPTWLNPVLRPAIDEARRVLAELLQTYRSRRDALQEVFNSSALTLDLRSLQARFNDVHTGLHKLAGAYREDKKTLAAATRSGKVTKEVLAKLHEAIEWQDQSVRLAQAEGRHRPLLGERYYPSRDGADLDEIERALAVADQALALASGDIGTEALARQLGVGATPDAGLAQAAIELSAAREALRACGLQAKLGPYASLVEGWGLSAAAQWCRDTAGAVRHLVGLVSQVDTAAEATLPVSDIRTLLATRATFARLDHRIAEHIAELRPILGPLADFPQPHLLEEAVEWVNSIRSQLGGQVPARSASALLRTDLTSAALLDPHTTLDKTFISLFGEFAPSYATELRSDCDTFENAQSLLAAMASSVVDIHEWESYSYARRALGDAGWEPAVQAAETARIREKDVGDSFEHVILSRWTDEIIASDPRLEPRRSVDRDSLAARFRTLDEELVADAAAHIINACAARRPKSLAGGAGIIQQQAQLKRRHKPVRKLLAEAGEVAQMLKPCFMMSPLSVSQFLPPGLRFDVVIFDEASQVREADAICSIYRGSQLLVAGDPKQLPPTDFFARTVDAGDWSEENDNEETLDFESVLDRCRAQGLTNLPLNWHYRSRHEALITFSNQSFYEGRLHTFPGATFDAADLGVALFKVDGRYRRGSTRDNPIEAETVVDRIVHHRRQHPELTLAVVALSVAQQTCIEAAIERRSGAEPELRDLVTDNRLDGFFVKNLENVQGDERDIILLSIGYGPDENNKLTMNFGPMNRSGGERRLNVAVTRARRRVEVVSSITAGQIVSEQPAIRHLARYLDYAERGSAALAMDLAGSRGDAESPFEEEVLRSIAALGFDAIPQVGVAGYRIDIGVHHPTKPGSYILGIECDGAAYHSAKVARDRDRLRQQVLEGLGWQIHRIWSTAWFSDRATEVTRIKASIEAALSGPPRPPRQPPVAPLEIIIDEVNFDDRPDWAQPYVVPILRTPADWQVEFIDPAARSTLRRQIVELVADHGPIHRNAALEVVRMAWGIGRSGSRIQQAFDDALQQARNRSEVNMDGLFLQGLSATVSVRVPTEDSATVRPVALVAPAELDLAILLLLGDAGPTDRHKLREHWKRLFGWRRVGSEIEVAFEEAVERLLSAGRIGGPDPLRAR